MNPRLLEPETSQDDQWVNAGDVAAKVVADIANKAKDKADEALDAKRVHGGMTLDEFLKKE